MISRLVSLCPPSTGLSLIIMSRLVSLCFPLLPFATLLIPWHRDPNPPYFGGLSPFCALLNFWQGTWFEVKIVKLIRKAVWGRSWCNCIFHLLFHTVFNQFQPNTVEDLSAFRHKQRWNVAWKYLFLPVRLILKSKRVETFEDAPVFFLSFLPLGSVSFAAMAEWRTSRLHLNCIANPVIFDVRFGTGRTQRLAPSRAGFLTSRVQEAVTFATDFVDLQGIQFYFGPDIAFFFHWFNAYTCLGGAVSLLLLPTQGQRSLQWRLCREMAWLLTHTNKVAPVAEALACISCNPLHSHLGSGAACDKASFSTCQIKLTPA